MKTLGARRREAARAQRAAWRESKPRTAPKNLYFNLDTELDNTTGRLLAVYLQVRKGKAAEVLELEEGNAYANYNSGGRLLGVELLGPCKIRLLDQAARNEPKEIRDFLKRNIPSQ